jgi:two-component system sensor histidine kinase KdpD
MQKQTRGFGAVKRIVLTLLFSGSILITTLIASEYGKIANASTVGFCFLILVLVSAFFADLTVAIATSVVATLCFNYFFLPPVGTWRIDAFDDWIALIAFLFTAVAISRLTAAASENASQRRTLERTQSRLKEFGLWLLSIPRQDLTFQKIAEGAVSQLGLGYCSLHLHTDEKWKHFYGTISDDLSKRVEENLRLSVERPFAVELIEEGSLGVRYTQIRKGMEPILVLVVKSTDLTVGGLNLLACMIGLLVQDILGKPNSVSNRKTG